MGIIEGAAQRFRPARGFPAIDIGRMVQGIKVTAGTIAKDVKGTVGEVAIFLASKERDTRLFDRFTQVVDSLMEGENPQGRYMQTSRKDDGNGNVIHFFRMKRKGSWRAREEDSAYITVTTRAGREESLTFEEVNFSPTHTVIVPVLSMGVKRSDGDVIPSYLTGGYEIREYIVGDHRRILAEEQLENVYVRLQSIKQGKTEDPFSKRGFVAEWVKDTNARSGIVFSQN